MGENIKNIKLFGLSYRTDESPSSACEYVFMHNVYVVCMLQELRERTEWNQEMCVYVCVFAVACGVQTKRKEIVRCVSIRSWFLLAFSRILHVRFMNNLRDHKLAT